MKALNLDRKSIYHCKHFKSNTTFSLNDITNVIEFLKCINKIEILYLPSEAQP